MAEYNKSKFFWIKLTDKFLSSDTVDFLMSQKGGANYVVLYQMLCLKTVNNDGILGRKLGEIIVEYDAEKICRDCKYFSIDTVRVALELYKKLGLVYQYEDGLLRITNFENLIGSKSVSAEKKQIQRDAKKALEIAEKTEGGQKVDICPPDIEIDIDIEIDKETDKDININKKSISEEFETLWKLYPNKKGKDKALSYYQKARKSGTSFEDVEKGIQNYLKEIEVKKTSPQYIKHGSTWFNQKGWLDDYDLTFNPSEGQKKTKYGYTPDDKSDLPF